MAEIGEDELLGPGVLLLALEHLSARSPEQREEKKMENQSDRRGAWFVLLLLLLRPWWTSISLAAAVVLQDTKCPPWLRAGYCTC